MTEYKFSSTNVNACISEGMHVILVEAASCLEYQTSSSELLAESVDNPKYQVIRESILNTVKDMTAKFLARCEEVSRAVVSRLKEFSLKLTNKTEEWLRAVQPRVEAAKKHEGWQNLRADVYPWNPVFLESGISNGIRKLHMSWVAAVVGGSYMENIIRELHNGSGETYLQNLIQELEYNIDGVEDNAFEAASQAFGLPANSVDDLWEARAIKAHGGAREPGYTYGRDIDKIMATLVNSSKLVDNVRKTYEDHAKELHDFSNELKGEMAEVGNLTAGVEGDATLVEESTKLTQRYIIRMTEFYESLMGKANSMNISMIQQMTADYMRCVNMFIAYKGPQRVAAPAR